MSLFLFKIQVIKCQIIPLCVDPVPLHLKYYYQWLTYLQFLKRFVDKMKSKYHNRSNTGISKN